MIRKFISGDELKLNPNQFSDPSDIMDVFSDETYEKNTLEDNGVVRCITCWKEYEPDHYAVFFLMEDNIEFKHSRELKVFIDNAIIELNPKTILTYSCDCEVLNRWHKFFGFKKEGDGLLIKGKMFNKWVIRRWE